MASRYEREIHGADPYVTVDVSPGHPLSLLNRDHEVPVSPISRLLGMPLRLFAEREVSVVQDWVGTSATDNQDATFLMMETDPSKPDWGWAPINWQMDLGNVVITRDDRQDVAVDVVKMICLYTREKLRPMFEDTLGSGNEQRTMKEAVLDSISLENMADWYAAASVSEC